MSKMLFEILRLVSRRKKIIKGTACKDPLYGTALNTVGQLSKLLFLMHFKDNAIHFLD
jgi:hypothetical protein